MSPCLHVSPICKWEVMACWKLSRVLGQEHSRRHVSNLLACLPHIHCCSRLQRSRCNLWYPQVLLFWGVNESKLQDTTVHGCRTAQALCQWVHFTPQAETLSSLCAVRAGRLACSWLCRHSLICHVRMRAESLMALSLPQQSNEVP